MQISFFGRTPDGKEVHRYRFTNTHGMVMDVTDYGASVYALHVPHAGKNIDVLLDYNTDDADTPVLPFLATTVGRHANRIGGACFELNGKTYALAQNDGPNNLHSGPDVYAARLWAVAETTENSVTFHLHSPDGDQGFPGAADIYVTYTLTEDNALRIGYRAQAHQDTILNLTNHAYFNLNGHNSGSVLSHRVWIDADAYTRADAASIPTGEITDVTDTPMDFRTPKTIAPDIYSDYEALIFGKGYDHNWCLNNGGQFAKVASLTGDISGLSMDVYTDLPGMQVYTANFLKDGIGKDGAYYNMRHGICFETQYYPDSIHHANFPSPVYKAGETLESTTEYRFY